MTIQNMTRDRDMMAFMLSGGRIDPMALVLANSLQVVISNIEFDFAMKLH